MVRVITVDGPSGAGKGTISRILAKKLGFHYLDSGALYRILGIAAQRHQVDTSNNKGLVTLAEHMDIRFDSSETGGLKALLEGEDITQEMRTEDTGALASLVASHPLVRSALLKRQRMFATEPGLIADGRDMGTVVFPDAVLKIYLTASIEERANRRYKELLAKGEDVSLRGLIEQVRTRDDRDMSRDASPLVPAEDAVELDTSEQTIQEVTDTVLNLVVFKGLFNSSVK
ncbi:MAG: cytidylate kinase [Porticoccaceae bacterium]|jgi:cytidylate kinase|tara:strand:+ start:1574 stop:2263 length:690 start_codon:yes stop_codon:yes gene_type:complete